jgi:hypothetical protein
MFLAQMHDPRFQALIKRIKQNNAFAIGDKKVSNMCADITSTTSD